MKLIPHLLRLAVLGCLLWATTPSIALAQEEANTQLASLILELLVDEDADIRALAFEQIRSEAAGETATILFASQLETLPSDVRVGLLRALAARGDSAARSAVIDQYTTSAEATVKAAAIEALGVLGNVQDVTLLSKVIEQSSQPLARVAEASLVRLQGESVPAAIMSELPKVSPETRVRLIEVLTKRRSFDAVPVMLDSSTGDSQIVRSAAMKGLSELATTDDIPAMLKGVLVAARGREQEAAEKAVMMVAQRTQELPQRARPLIDALPNFSAADQLTLLSTLGRIGGEDALAIIESAIDSSNTRKHDAGIRALCNWPNAAVAEQMISLINGDIHPSHRLQLLRSLLRIAPLPDGRSDAEKLALLKRAIDLSQRDEEVLYGLSRTSAIRIPETLRFVLSYIEQPKYREAACLAIVELAHHRSLREPNKAEFDAALDKVIASSSSAIVVDRAKRYKQGKTWVRPQ